MARAQQQPQRAARLLGTAEALRQAIGSTMHAYERVEYQKEVAPVRAALDAATFDAAWAAGRAMDIDQAIEYAVNTDVSPDHR